MREADRDPKALRLVGALGPDSLDTCVGYLTQTWALSRMYARTLFALRGGPDLATGMALEPDLARNIPSRAGGQVSADGREHCIQVRSGVYWNTRDRRQVVARDVERGIRRLGNRVSPSPAAGLYGGVIEGLEAFYADLANAPATDPVTAGARIWAPVTGLRSPEPDLLVVRTREPCPDLYRLLSLAFAAAVPEEYESLIPGSPELERSIVSCGPYAVTRYDTQRIELSPNPAWCADADPIRRQIPTAIHVDLGLGADEVQAALESGEADLSWDQRIPTEAMARARREGDPRLFVAVERMLSPFLALNQASERNGAALRSATLRQGLHLALDKAALADIYGGPPIAVPQHQTIPHGQAGHAPITTFATPGDRGDREEARRRIAASGVALTDPLRLVHRISSSYPEVARIVANCLTAVGVPVELVPDSDGSIYNTAIRSDEARRAGTWDLALPGWVPDWYGNNGRTAVAPLFDSRAGGGRSPNYGGYVNPAVNDLIDAALGCTDEEEAGQLWHEVDKIVTEECAIIPLLFQNYPIFRSSRVACTTYLPGVQSYDYSTVSLDGDA